MIPLARIVIRGEGNKDGLIMGMRFTSSLGILKPNTIYEIKAYLETLTIEEVGTSCVQTGKERIDIVKGELKDFPAPFNWCYSVREIIGTDLFRYMLLTREEYKQIHVSQLKNENTNWAKAHKETCPYCKE